MGIDRLRFERRGIPAAQRAKADRVDLLRRHRAHGRTDPSRPSSSSLLGSRFRHLHRASPTPAEALDAITGYAAYFGTYRVDERAKTVTHKRIGNVNPGALGDFVRRYEFQGDDVLELTPLERRDVRAVRLSWKRLKRTSPGDPSRR